MEESNSSRSDCAPAGQEIMEPLAVMLPNHMVQGCTKHQRADLHLNRQPGTFQLRIINCYDANVI